MISALELDMSDGRAFERGKQDTPQAVADGRAEAALERLSGELAIRIGGNLLITDDPRRQFQSTPTNSHCVILLCITLDRGRFPPQTIGAICSSTSPTDASDVELYKSDSTLLRRTAPVVRQWGDVLNSSHFQSCVLQVQNGLFAAGAGALHFDLDFDHAALARLLGSVFRGAAGCVGRAL